MQLHFSIVSACIRPEIPEQISIGLIVVSEGSIWFEFSKNKLNIAKKLLSPAMFKYLKDSLKQLSKAAEDAKQSNFSLFPGQDTNTQVFSLGYLEYLSRYSNNLLTFCKPKVLELEANAEVFGWLFKKYVDDKEYIATKTAIKLRSDKKH